MTELTVMDTNDRVVHRCASFTVGESGIKTKNEEDEVTGFFPFGHFAYVAADQKQANQQSAGQGSNPRSNPQR